MAVSENRGTPKSSILIGFSIVNHPFWGATIFGNPHIQLFIGVLFCFKCQRSLQYFLPNTCFLEALVDYMLMAWQNMTLTKKTNPCFFLNGNAMDIPFVTWSFALAYQSLWSHNLGWSMDLLGTATAKMIQTRHYALKKETYTLSLSNTVPPKNIDQISI